MRALRLAAVCVLLTTASARAQEQRRGYAGALLGVSTLSADGRAVVSGADAALSMFKPENGAALNVFAGLHVHRFFALQGDYMWNRNDLGLVSSLASAQGGVFYEQQRRSRQHAVVADTLLYFRPLGNRIRPYLGTGLSIVHFSSAVTGTRATGGLAPPAGTLAATKVGLRSHVGIDLAFSPRVAFRYSFSETISRNPISPHLTPPGERGLANFQNLFGLVARF